MVDFKIVILSRKSQNVLRCCQSIFDKDPQIRHKNIVVVDDGAGTPETRAALDVTWVAGAKPFVFARNTNIGLVAADENVILLNDDTTLETARGFSVLTEQAPMTALTAVNLAGHCPTDYPARVTTSASDRLNFVCVYIPRHVYLRVGPFDERFIRYGWEDTDYCHRARLNGFELMTFGGCTVAHDRDISTFHGPEEMNGVTHFYDGDNKDIFRRKWNRSQ